MYLSKGMGPDMIGPLFIRKCADWLSEPLYSKSLNETVYPDVWKIGQITPIHKSGEKNDVHMNREVNVLPNLGKIFEIIVYNQLKLILTPCLSSSQHGFIPNRNIQSNIIELTINMHNAFDNNNQIDVFYADISNHSTQ